jgi:hypothetical protein
MTKMAAFERFINVSVLMKSTEVIVSPVQSLINITFLLTLHVN